MLTIKQSWAMLTAMTFSGLTLLGPGEQAKVLAARVRELRLRKRWTRRTLAQRAGISEASLKRFETAGLASLELVLKVAHALARLEEFNKLLLPPVANSLAELEARVITPVRQRGRI